ncbi:RT0821/Lpp0805 family surface protein [Parvibaculum sp.]|uniref:RT0821/Lpp0805 family surface protein n=1 Tax=Parvibaculum sp. TaxID=2024848 RepID=UPI00272FC840|nr:RT0821/Lpp0805 family surface protein [Parvibaculum sp.]MDP1626854.1 RT0821/Lpp0805 family surface protein [Parvibaculum sp.]MDP2148500.1 RT0821/Lpp0805 family surface protein [Parvibaculum sp.]MDP3329577.1 RT0821/Lpp0805 family surface protein [Parvibaculum sp.]
MKIIKGLAIGAVALSLAACDQSMYGGGGGGISKQSVGTVGGAVAGGLAGSQIGGGSGRLWATGAGVLLGALIGSEIGKSLDRADQAYMGQTTYNALETGKSGQPVQWRNPDSGHYGTVTPQPAYQQAGLQCREYSQTVYIDGKSQQAYGTACRQPDGSWQIKN